MNKPLEQMTVEELRAMQIDAVWYGTSNIEAFDELALRNKLLVEALERARAEEREACAQIVENADIPDCAGWDTSHISETIRNRSTAALKQSEGEL